MTRMIEEERIEIGTLKALGYTNLQIISNIFYTHFSMYNRWIFRNDTMLLYIT